MEHSSGQEDHREHLDQEQMCGAFEMVLGLGAKVEGTKMLLIEAMDFYDCDDLCYEKDAVKDLLFEVERESVAFMGTFFT